MKKSILILCNGAERAQGNESSGNGEGIMLNIKQVAQRLHDKGMRATPQRVAVYEALTLLPDHPDLAMVYDAMKKSLVSMPQNRVKNALDTLCKAGIIQMIQLRDGVQRYDLDTEGHLHFSCTECGAIENINAVAQDDFLAQVRAKTDYHIMDWTFYFYGCCRKCQGREKDCRKN